ncbi:MAG: DUF1512 domain-containing protein [Thermoproteota archaeon]|nr:MAG: DUF1512 domain-containing protein [Candidatus Korarchaeota archaeon]RLG48780.1 MAG: DUF1512 domain-containing protein [Candidatus Korarchaeota archaeon]
MVDFSAVMSMLAMLQQSRDDWFSWMVFLLFMVIMNFYANRLQVQFWMGQIGRALDQLNRLRLEAEREFVKTASKYGKEKEKIKKALDRFIGFFTIEPEITDPAGAMVKLDHIVRNREDRLNFFIKEVAPSSDEVALGNLRDLLESTIALDFIFRIVRHYFVLGKKTQNMIYIAQIQMQLPEIMRMARAWRMSVEASKLGLPLGDGIGALVALKMIGNSELIDFGENVVGTELNIEGRRVLVLKAKGPGGEVGKPGEALKRIIESRAGNVNRIVMIDAALKLEGERTGEIAEGVGAAIGGIGVERWKIEEVATKYGIPLDAIVVKEDYAEAIAAMTKEIAKKANEVVNRVKEAILSRTSEGDYVIVVGVGNSAGIGNRLEVSGVAS